MIDNRRDAEVFVIDCIENGDASADQYDIDAIVDACYDKAGGWNIDAVEAEEFWEIVEANALEVP